MRASLISINFAPELTGIAVYSTGLAEYLAQTDCEVTVHTGFPYYPQWKKERADRGRLFRAVSHHQIALRRCYLYVPDRPTALRRILHELSFMSSAALSYLFAPCAKVTIIVTPPLILAIPLLLIARLKGSRTILHVQDLQPDTAVELGILKKGLWTSILFRLERLGYALADRVATIGEGMRKKIIDKGVPSAKVMLFRNWVDASPRTPLRRETGYRAEWGLQGKVVVLYSGNLGVKQGLDALLEAASIIRDRTDIVFVIVGDGSEGSVLAALAARLKLEQVLFKPLQPFERLAELLATADISVIPQRHGVTDFVLPSKLCNILASGRPVVAAAQSDSELARIIVDGNCGRVVDTGQSAALADAIIALANDPAEGERLGNNARLVAKQMFSSDAILGGFYRELELLIGRRESPPIRAHANQPSPPPF